MKSRTIRLHPEDNVVVALEALEILEEIPEEDDMDINCGVIVDGEASVEETGYLIFKKILDSASGKRTRSELLGFGDNEFVPWHMGAIL